MSGKDEQPYKEPEFPLCSQCGHNTWVRERDLVESVFVSKETDDEYYKWTDDEEVTGDSSPWRCRSCNRFASNEQMSFIHEYYCEAEWI